MFPLRHKSVVSMRKMQEIQPQVKAIQDRYAKLKVTDPAQAEDEHGDDGALPREGRQPGERLRADAADVAGAVRVLRAAVGRRSSCAARRSSAGFTTCRSPIRYYVTPVLMGATHVLAAEDDAGDRRDPAQQKMMMFMPIMFRFMFLSSAGRHGALLVREQRLGIGQQYFTN